MRVKRFLSLIFVLVVYNFYSAGAATIFWGNGVNSPFPDIVDSTGTAIPDSSTWVLRMYFDGGNGTIDFANGDVTGDDTWTTLEGTWNSAGAPGYFAIQVDFSDSTYGIVEGSTVYTVLFDSSSYATANNYVVIDDSLATINYVGGQNTYDPGGTLAGEWQAVPEPSTLALLGIGSTVMLVRKRRRSRSRK